MRIAGSIIILICGIAVLIGVFLPWGSVSMWGFTISVSGWEAIRDLGVSEAPEPLLVLIGGIVILACALPAFTVSLATKGAKGALRALGIVASVGALIALGGALWAFFPAVSEMGAGFTSYGLYVCIAAAVLGLIFGIVTSATGRSSTS